MYYILQAIVIICTALAVAIFVGQIARRYIGYNPTAPSLLGRVWRALTNPGNTNAP